MLHQKTGRKELPITPSCYHQLMHEAEIIVDVLIRLIIPSGKRSSRDRNCATNFADAGADLHLNMFRNQRLLRIIVIC